MATMRQRKAIKLCAEKLRKNEPVKLGQIMLQAGYSKTSSESPQVLTESKTWIDTMKGINWGKQLKQVENMGDAELNEDKDNCLKAKDMLFKLGDKYPKQTSVAINLFQKIRSIED